ncbi:MAG: carboxypeptidase-like regulatory domain-containing protein, partial [Nitrospinales bacterium]
IPSDIFPRISYSLTAKLESFESEVNDLDLSNRISLVKNNISFSNTLNGDLSFGGDTETNPVSDGVFKMSGRIKKFSPRGTLNYEIYPSPELTSAGLTGDYDFTRYYSIRFALDQELTDDKKTTFSLGWNRRFEKFDVGVDGTVDDNGDFTLGASISFGLGRKPRSKKWTMQSRRMATTGAASTRVFVDNNQNGRFEPEEDEPIQDVQFKVGPRDVKTDSEGVAFLPGLSSHRKTNVLVDIRSLEDPFWVLPEEGFEVIPRPGRPILLEFPVVPTGEVDGTVFLRSGDTEKSVSNAEVQLVDVKGEVVQEVKTEFDGFYLFMLVPPGKYTVRISPEQVKRLKLAPSPEFEVVLEGEEMISSGVDLVVESAPKTKTDSDP